MNRPETIQGLAARTRGVDRDAPRQSDAEIGSEGAGNVREEEAARLLRGQSQSPGGGGIQKIDPLVEVENDDAGRRGLEDLGQEVMLLAEFRAFVAQIVSHTVIEENEAIKLRPAGFLEARGELLLIQKPCAFSQEIETVEQPSHEAKADEDRKHEKHLDGQEPQAVGDQERNHQSREGDMEDRHIDEETVPETQRRRSLRP